MVHDSSQAKRTLGKELGCGDSLLTRPRALSSGGATLPSALCPEGLGSHDVPDGTDTGAGKVMVSTPTQDLNVTRRSGAPRTSGRHLSQENEQAVSTGTSLVFTDALNRPKGPQTIRTTRLQGHHANSAFLFPFQPPGFQSAVQDAAGCPQAVTRAAARQSRQARVHSIHPHAATTPGPGRAGREAGGCADSVRGPPCAAWLELPPRVKGRSGSRLPRGLAASGQGLCSPSHVFAHTPCAPDTLKVILSPTHSTPHLLCSLLTNSSFPEAAEISWLP